MAVNSDASNGQNKDCCLYWNDGDDTTMPDTSPAFYTKQEVSMNFNPRKNSLQLSPDDARQAYSLFIYSLRSIRELAGLPLDKYKQEGGLDAADHAQRGIIDGANKLGIDMGAEWGNELDLRNEDDLEDISSPSELHT